MIIENPKHSKLYLIIVVFLVMPLNGAIIHRGDVFIGIVLILAQVYTVINIINRYIK